MNEETVLKIKNCLDNHSDYNFLKSLDDDALQAKEQIRLSINNLIFKLRLREQWLLHHVDQVHQCFANDLKGQSEDMFKIYGKIQSLVDISASCKAESSKIFHSYALSCLHELERIKKQDGHYEKGSIVFSSDDEELRTLISQFGRISNSTINSDLDESEKSSNLSDTDTLSLLSGNQNFDLCAEYHCKNSCIKAPYEIEDMDKHLDNFKLIPSLAVSSFCKANEVCCNVSECLFDEPCHVAAAEKREEKKYVDEIEKAMQDICESQEVSSNPNQHEVDPSTSKSNDFEKVMLNLTNTIDSIIIGNDCPKSLVDRNHSSPLVESLSVKINEIINNQSCFNTSISHLSPVPHHVSVDPIEVINMEMAKLSTYQPPVISHMKDGSYADQHREKMDWKKVPVDEDFYEAKGNGQWCSIEDVADVLKSIIES